MMLRKTPRTDQLDRDILVLFKRACRQNRLDVAEQLLRALETLERKPGVQAHPLTECTLMEAYRELVHAD
jgi:hypothetical protein